MKFYPADWRADPALRSCSIAARGLWIEMLSIMHEANPRGDLLIKGNQVKPEMLASLTGVDIQTVNQLLEELENMAVFSRRKNGTIYSRRMEKDEIKARKLRENGKKGGNPKLRKQTKKDDQDNQTETRELSPQKPEARSQSIPLSNDNGDDPEKKLFEDGKQLLGKSSGGMINKLLRARGLDGAQSIIDEAKSKQDPREWVGAALREDDDLVAGMAAINRMRERIEANG
jgi:hypothetical protein